LQTPFRLLAALAAVTASLTAHTAGQKQYLLHQQLQQLQLEEVRETAVAEEEEATLGLEGRKSEKS